MDGGERFSLADHQRAGHHHSSRSRAGHRCSGRNSGVADAKCCSSIGLVFALPSSIAQPRLRTPRGRGVFYPCESQVDNGFACVTEFPSSSTRRCLGCARARRLSMADTVFISFFPCRTAHLGRSMGLECLAEHTDYALPFGNDFLPRLVKRAFSARNGFGPCRQSFRGSSSAKVPRAIECLIIGPVLNP